MTESVPPALEQLLVETGFGRVRLAWVAADGRLMAVRDHIEADRSRVGDILLGRVRRLDRGLDAAFVDIGAARPALLRAVDCRHFQPPGLPGDGAMVLVQVDRDADPAADKGARVTSRIRLAGPWAVLTPCEPGVPPPAGGDRSDAVEAVRTAVAARLAAGDGALLRTAAWDAVRQDAATAMARVSGDLSGLAADWQAVLAAARTATPPRLLRAGPGWVETLLAAWGAGQSVRIDARLGTIDGQPAGARIRALLDHWRPAMAMAGAGSWHWHDGVASLFEAVGIAAQIDAALQPAVSLPSGGRLIIEATAALTAIDVDSGTAGRHLARDAGPSALADGVNREAVAEIARQLRLRRLGGLVVIDFLTPDARTRRPDPGGAEERGKERGKGHDGERDRRLSGLAAALRRALATDPVPVRLAAVPAFGLVVLTRQRAEPSLAEHLLAPCLACAGTGDRPAALPAALDALAAVAAATRRSPGQRPRLRTAVDVAAALDGPAAAARAACAAALGEPVEILTAGAPSGSGRSDGKAAAPPAPGGWDVIG